MKSLGLIGGTTWLSTVDYYRLINQKINEKLGGLTSAKIFLCSVNFAEVNALVAQDKWNDISEMFSSAAHKLQIAGAECILICANTPHKIAGNVKEAIDIPLIHIAEETAKEIKKKEIGKVGLLGTKFTMEGVFFTDVLTDNGIESYIPDENDRQFIHDTIFEELGKNIFKQETKSKYLNIIDKLLTKGAEGIIMGCTEIPLLIKQEDCSSPLFDTLQIHAEAAVKFALSEY